MDLVEVGDALVLKADLPGLRREDVSIEVKDGVLTISGERKDEHEEKADGYLPRRADIRKLLAGADAAEGRRSRRHRR